MEPESEMASSAFFRRFKNTSCNLTLSPLKEPIESGIEEENSISVSFVSKEIAKDLQHPSEVVP